MSNSAPPWPESARTTNVLLSLVILTLAVGFLHVDGSASPFTASILSLLALGSVVATVIVATE